MLIRFYIPMHILFQGTPIVGLIVSAIYAHRRFAKFGSVPRNRVVYLFVFAMYMLFAYYLIIRPFAGFSLVAAMTNPTMQLVPFQSLRDFFQNSGFVWADASTWLPAFGGRIFRSIVLNVLFFVPIGLFIRGACGASVKRTLIVSFLICLFFELTQLSGLYFIYPRPYRIFDVDDFITNLLGALIGALIAPPIFRHLPTPLPTGGKQITKGNEVPFARRLCAMLIDQGLMMALSLGLANACFSVFDGDFLHWTLRNEAAYIAATLILAFLWAIIQFATRGRSLGLRLFGLRICSTKGERPTLWQCVLRSVLFALTWALPSLTFTLISTVHFNGFRIMPIALALEICILIFQVYLYVSLVCGAVTGSVRLFYDRLSATRLGGSASLDPPPKGLDPLESQHESVT